MTDKALKRIWVMPDYDDHTNPVSDDWSFGTWDATPSTSSATPYVPATALDAAQARIAELEAMLTEDVTAPYLAGLARGRAEMQEEAATKAEKLAAIYDEVCPNEDATSDLLWGLCRDIRALDKTPGQSLRAKHYTECAAIADDWFARSGHGSPGGDIRAALEALKGGKNHGNG